MRNRKSDLAVLGNKIINSSYSLEETEKKLILAILGELSPKLIDKTKLDGRVINAQEGEVVNSTTLYSIRVQEYANLYGLEVNNARKQLKQAATSLFNRQITFKTDTTTSLMRWVQKVVFDTKTDTVGVVWSNDIVPFISQLTSNFTQLRLKDISNFSGMYSIRLYELLLAKYKERGYRHEVTFTLEELYFAMAVPVSLQNYAEFKRRILSPSMKDVGKIIRCKVDEVKIRRTVKELLFTVAYATDV